MGDTENITPPRSRRIINFLAKLDYLSDIFGFQSKTNQWPALHMWHNICSQPQYKTDRVSNIVHQSKRYGPNDFYTTISWIWKYNSNFIGVKRLSVIVFFLFPFFQYQIYSFFFFVSKWSNILTLNRKLAKTFTISGIKPVTPLRPWTSWSTFELVLRGSLTKGQNTAEEIEIAT